MFEPFPELSPDLEWMLQSGQASGEMLAEALVQEYYRPVYRLALSILDDEEAAESATLQTFVYALLNVYQYRNKTSARIWLFRIALKTCRKALHQVSTRRGLKAMLPLSGRPTSYGITEPTKEIDAALWLAVDRLGEKTRIPLLLRFVHGWEVSEIAELLRIREKTLKAQLNNTRRKLERALTTGAIQPGFSQEVFKAENLDALLAQSLQARWPAPEFSEVDMAEVVQAVLYRSGRLGTRRQRFVAVKEILLTGIAIVLVIGLIWAANRLLPEADPEKPASNASSNHTAQPGTRRRLRTPRSMSGFSTRIRREPTYTPTPETVFYIVKHGDTLEKVAELLNTSVEALKELNRLPPGTALLAGQRLLIPESLPRSSSVTATPVTPVPQATLKASPANASDILEQVSRRADAWHTLWIDAEVMNYGPEGYVGPPLISRLQAWLGENQALVLSGSFSDGPDEVFLYSNDQAYLAKPGSNLPWFIQVRNMYPFNNSIFENIDLLLSTPFSEEIFAQGNNVKIVGNDSVAGRQATVVDQLGDDGKRISRAWVDIQTGILLRKQLYGGQDHQSVLKEAIIHKIAYDVNLPQDLLDPNLPWRGGYARDYTGKPEANASQKPNWEPVPGHELLPKIPPPPDFALAQNRLTFQYRADFNQNASQSVVDLFAGNYYLGEIAFGNPWTMICQRSPDGKKIAYVSQPIKSQDPDAFLHWFSIMTPLSQFPPPLRGVYVTQFAFAPDNRQIAVFGYVGQFVMGSIFVFDTETGQVRMLRNQGDVKSLVWSPDGQYLAYIGRDPAPQFNDEVIVIRVDNGNVTFHSSTDYEHGNSSMVWPPAAWDVEFPVEMGGLESCTAAPAR